MPEEAVATCVGERQGVSKTFCSKINNCFERKAHVEKNYSTKLKKEENKKKGIRNAGIITRTPRRRR